MTVSNDLLMPAKIRSAGTLYQNPQKTVIATNIAF